MHSKQHFDCKCSILEAIPPEKQYPSSLCPALLGAGSTPVLALQTPARWRSGKEALRRDGPCCRLPVPQLEARKVPAEGLGTESGVLRHCKC